MSLAAYRIEGGVIGRPVVAPAIANAVFDSLGVRVRDLPLTAEHIRAVAAVS